MYEEHNAVEKPRPNRSGFAITSFVMSVVGFFIFLLLVAAAAGNRADDAVLGLLAILLLFVDVFGIVFGALSLKSSSLKGLAIAGFVIAIVPISLFFILILMGLAVEGT